MDLLSSPPPTPTSDDSSLDTFKSDDVLATMQEVQNFENGNPLLQLCINSIRFLCIDAINLAGSGHPGICMGMAPAIFTLFERHLSFCPSNPNWLNRDRFILSAGHGSMLLYSILHLYGYSSVTMNDICNFRRLHSSTPGHPECTMTPGVEVSTGPLGQGIANAVGFAIAEAHICALFSRPDAMIVDNFTFCVVGDGCLMEGISSEACSLAGHLKLGKLIVLYDDNHMSIDGSTDLAFTENVSARFEAYGWHMVHVENGNSDIEAIDAAILAAKQCTSKPSLIKITTKIGYGSPKLQNTPAAHGSPINMSETAATRKALNYPYEPFHIPDNVLQHFRRKVQTGKHLESCWEMNLASYKGLYPELYTRFSQDVIQGEWPLTLGAELYKAAKACEKSSMATRNFSGIMLNTVAPVSGLILGGSADTATSTMTHLACSKEFTPTIRVGRNIRFGVREHAMGGICNGIALCGYNLRPFCGTFLVFSGTAITIETFCSQTDMKCRLHACVDEDGVDE